MLFNSNPPVLDQHRYWIPSSFNSNLTASSPPKQSSPASLQKMTSTSSQKKNKKKGSKKSSSKKRSLDQVSTSMDSPSINQHGSNLSVHHQHQKTIAALPLTKEERKRRKERQARFQANSDSHKDKNNRNDKKTTPTVVDPLYRPLSSGRRTSLDTASLSSQGSSSSLSHNTNGGSILVGTNPRLEKPYLRLTTYPDPTDVRPLPVLIKALAHVKNKYLLEEDFEWANEQLKSMRQDLTVQRIKNPFVLEVYETHARLLLENGDLNEFNQCQSMIRTLCGSGGAKDMEGDAAATAAKASKYQDDEPHVVLQQSKEAADEFAGYALLYALVRNAWLDLNQALKRPQELANKPQHPQKKPRLVEQQNVDQESLAATGHGLYPCRNSPESRYNCACSSYQHALCVVRSVVDDDFKTFFRLYENAPHLSAYLMDFLVKRVREAAYVRAIASYRPNIGMEQFREWLCLADLEQTRHFLKQQGAVFVQEAGVTAPFWVDCKASLDKQGGQTKQQQH